MLQLINERQEFLAPGEWINDHDSQVRLPAELCACDEELPALEESVTQRPLQRVTIQPAPSHVTETDDVALGSDRHLGLRKIRWEAAGRGKRGGVRVVYYWARKHDVILLLVIYGKNQQDDLTAGQRAVLKKLIKEEYP